MALADVDLDALIAALAGKPGHETVRLHLGRALIDGLGANPNDITQEIRIEARSRVDTLLSDTVFEIKSDLDRERADAEGQLLRYIERQEHDSARRYIGVATDGRDYWVYERRGGALHRINEYRLKGNSGRDFLVWLESVVSVSPDLPADALTVTQELGRDSTAYGRARGILEQAWSRLAGNPEARLKRQLWSDLLSKVYGKPQDADELWIQHSYLTVVAKSFAFCALQLRPRDASDLLDGTSFEQAGIRGAVEGDFFDWVLGDPEGKALAESLFKRVQRFRVKAIDTDVLKTLYESLIDPDQRHDLGEYYTPDWLAERMCRAAIDNPLKQRVLDPACGSGTFLFHAIRLFSETARRSKMPSSRIAAEATGKIIGLDIHPVAVIIARVTYLLALGSNLLAARKGDLSIPVYLGDALQWSTRAFMGQEEIVIDIPPEKKDGPRGALSFPVSLAEQPGLFDSVASALVDLSERHASETAARNQLAKLGDIAAGDLAHLLKTYNDLQALQKAGRNHVWGYVARNLARPLWLSKPEQRPDRVIGNPPWLSFRYMSPEMQTRVREHMKGFGIWVGGKVATHQDLSAYFFARCAQLYLNRGGGRIAFLLPMAALTRAQFERFRTGTFREGSVQFTDAWTFDEDVQPLFPVPSCALFAERAATSRAVPKKVTAFSGRLPYRNMPAGEASKHLREIHGAAPGKADLRSGTPYREAFRQGATLVPRMLCYVERRATGGIGAGARIPVESRKTSQDKKPWKNLPSLSGAVEREFLRPALLGESIAPYRILDWPEAIVPFDKIPLDARKAAEKGYSGLADWMRQAEVLWDKNSAAKMKLIDRWDFYRLLTSQFPIASMRVAYAKAGTLPAACLIEDQNAVLDHKLYWCPVEDRREGLYLCALVNSEETRKRIAHLQSRGQWGARDFDKVLFTLPIPRFSGKEVLHREIAVAAEEAERIAATVELEEDMYFTTARKRIREALAEAGVSQKIDKLVSQLLNLKS